MALTETPLTMASAVHAFAQLDTQRQLRMLKAQGQNYSTEDIVNRMRSAYPQEWSALVLAMLGTTWHDFAADMAVSARYTLASVAA